MTRPREAIAPLDESVALAAADERAPFLGRAQLAEHRGELLQLVEARVRLVMGIWMLRRGESAPRFITAFPANKP